MDKLIIELLNEKYIQFNHTDFIENDPIQIPHLFDQKEDIEIAAFLTATIAWGNRQAIIKSARWWMQLLDNAPFDFIMNAEDSDYTNIQQFYYRTFNGVDCVHFLKALRKIYQNHGGLEKVFTQAYQQEKDIKNGLIQLHHLFFDEHSPQRSQKHLANVLKGASAKRLNMFLRWMVRKDNNGVDFGIWNEIPASCLYLPLDVHTGNVARALGLLQRKSNDWKAVEEITNVLRMLDANDPIKYDFALFGMGVEGYLKS